MAEISGSSRRLRVLASHLSPSATEAGAEEVALIIGAGPGVSASCARLFRKNGMKVAVASRTPAAQKPAVQALVDQHGCRAYTCNAADPASVKGLFEQVTKDMGRFPDLVLLNASGSARGPIDTLDPEAVKAGLMNSVFAAFLVAQQAAVGMAQRGSGSIFFTGSSASYKGYPNSSSFAMGSQGRTGLVQSLARELGPKGVHVAHFPLDASVRPDPSGGSKSSDPDHVAETYWFVHKQPRSTWTYEVVLRPWVEKF